MLENIDDETIQMPMSSQSKGIPGDRGHRRDIQLRRHHQNGGGQEMVMLKMLSRELMLKTRSRALLTSLPQAEPQAKPDQSALPLITVNG